MDERSPPKYTYAQIDAMRAKLAKLWGQRIDQVTEAEARHYLSCRSDVVERHTRWREVPLPTVNPKGNS